MNQVSIGLYKDDGYGLLTGSETVPRKRVMGTDYSFVRGAEWRWLTGDIILTSFKNASEALLGEDCEDCGGEKELECLHV